MSNYNTREQWLTAAIGILAERFFKCGLTIPDKTKVSCGWTIGNRKKVAGEMWVPTASKGGFIEIFISPVHDAEDVAGPNGALETLVHECIHAAIYPERGHKTPFKHAMKAIGLEGPAKATSAGTELCEYFKELAARLGPYPHSALELSMRDVKKQTTRLLKVGCEKHEYIIRVTRKCMDIGAPLCPICKKPFVEMA